ncbi:MAG: ATP synthase subunit C [Thermovirgaceae bacterium]|nr:ATP synthase subunit C [Thermovirgaceae bacterium]
MTGSILMAAAIITTLGAGWVLNGKLVSRPRRVLSFVSGCALIMLFAGAALAVTEGTSASAAGWAYMGASLAAGLACIGAGIAVAVVGAAALGVVGEKPELLGSTLIYLGLAEGIAIYGVIVALLILGKV